MEIKVHTEWIESIKPAFLVAFGYCQKVMCEEPKPFVASKELEMYSGLSAMQVLEGLKEVIGFQIKSHNQWWIKPLREVKTSGADKNLKALLQWLLAQAEFGKVLGNKKHLAIEQCFYEMLQGRFIQIHRWRGAEALHLEQKVMDLLAGGKPVNAATLISLLQKALDNLRYGVSLGYTSSVIGWSKGKLRIDPMDFLLVEDHNGFADSLFLEFSTTQSQWRIPGDWKDCIYEMINQSNYGALLEAGAFATHLENAWSEFLQSNQKFITRSKAEILQALMDGIRACKHPRLRHYPLPDPNSYYYKELKTELEKAGTIIPEWNWLQNNKGEKLNARK